MLSSFPPQRIKQAQDLFKRKTGLDISEETANEYLRSLADQFLAFSDVAGVLPRSCARADAEGYLQILVHFVL